MNNKADFGFVVEYVSDIKAVKEFYVNVLGLEVKQDHPMFVQFNHYAIASDESLSGTGDPEFYWVVENAEAAFNDLSQKAVVILAPQQKPFGKVFGIRDPAGQALYFVEFAQNRPSTTVSEKTPG